MDSLAFEGGVYAEGGSVSGLSFIRIYFGSWSAEAETSSHVIYGPRSNARATFFVHWYGGVPGECAGTSLGRLLNVGSLGRAADTPTDVTPLDAAAPAVVAADLGEFEAAAAPSTLDDRVVVTVTDGEYTAKAAFTQEQVANGKASIRIDAGEGRSQVVTYSPNTEAEFSITDAASIPRE